MRLLLFAGLLSAAAYQQTPEQQRQWEQTQRNYQDHVRAEVRGTTAKSIEEPKPMPKKLKTWAELNTECEELRATIARLKTELKSEQAKNLLGQHPAEGKQ